MLAVNLCENNINIGKEAQTYTTSIKKDKNNKR